MFSFWDMYLLSATLGQRLHYFKTNQSETHI